MGTQGTSLRDLARAFAKGELGRDQYRRDRSKLIAAILAGEAAVRNLDFPPPIKPPGGGGSDATEPRSRRRRAESGDEPESTTQITPARARAAPAPAPAAKPSAGPRRFIAVVLLIGITAAVIWYVASRPASQAPATADAAPPAPAPETAAEDPRAEAGRTLISQFLQDRNWSASRMSAFQSDWTALDAEQRTAALGSTDAGRLASAIYQRLLEERAVSGLGDLEASLARQRDLVRFANAIGISDARLSVPDSPARSEAAAASPDATKTD